MSASNDPNMQGGGVADGAQAEQVSSAQRIKRALANGKSERISDHTAFFLQEVAGEPATLIEYGETDAIFTSPMDKRTEDYITGRFG